MTASRSILIAAACLLAAPGAAHAGTYTAAYTAPDAHWSFTSAEGPYAKRASAFGIDARAGRYAAWSRAAWRFNAPPTTRIIAGTFAGSYATPNAAFGMLIRVGSDSTGSAVSNRTSSGSYSTSFTGSHTWAENMLRTTTASDPTASGANYFALTSATFTLSDDAAPALIVSEPQPRWYGPGCEPLPYTATDAGSGVWTTTVHDSAVAGRIDGYQAQKDTPAKPGAASVQRIPCVAVHQGGTHNLTLTAKDYAGNTTTRTLAMKFDISAPTVDTTLRDNAITGDYRPRLSFAIDDTQSGVRNAYMTLNGSLLDAPLVGGVISHRPDGELELGEHTVTVVTSDHVGNTRTVSHRFEVRDLTAPMVSVAAPGASGSNTPVLDASASDDKTGLDEATWRVSVNGQQLAAYPQDNRILVDLGFLVNQYHDIVISVRDKAGNVRVHKLQYLARSTSTARLFPAKTGVFVFNRRRKVRRGQTIRVSGAAALRGRPMAGMRAELRQGGRTIAGKVITVNGTVNMQVTIRSRRPVYLVVDGSGLGRRRVPLRIR